MKKLLFMMLMMAMTLTASAQNSKEDEAAALVESGIKLHDQSKYEEAIKMYDKALKVSPKNLTATYEKAYTLNAMGKKEDAIKILEKATKIDNPTADYATIFTFLGNLYDETGQIDKSIDTYKKELQLTGLNTEDLGPLYYNLGITCLNAHYNHDNDGYYANEAEKSLRKSFVCRPQHLRTNINIAKLYVEYNFFCDALAHLSLYAICVSSQGANDGLDELLESWTNANIPERVSYRSTEDSIAINKMIEIGKQPRSQYGLIYDVCTGVFKTICADIKDEPFHPVEVYNDSTKHDPILCLYARLLRDGELEAFMHVAGKASKSGHIANGDWCSQNKELVDKALAFIKEGQYLCELKDYKPKNADGPTEADKAHENIDEAKAKMQEFLREKMNTEKSKEDIKYLLAWLVSSPDVDITLGDAEIQWSNQSIFPCSLAYMCGGAMYQLEQGSKDFTPEAYLAGYRTMLKYYEENKDVIGNVPTLQNYLKLMKENPAKFEETIKNNMPKEQK